MPIAIIVTPIIASDTPHDAAISLPLFTSNCEPATMPAAPTTTRSMLVMTDFLSLAGRSSSLAAASSLAERIFSIIYSANMNIMTAAPTVVNAPPSEQANSATTAATSSSDLGANSRRLMASGMNIMLIASIIAVLHMTEPMPLPMAMPTLPCDAAM